jgi:hypothetical protein
MLGKRRSWYSEVKKDSRAIAKHIDYNLSNLSNGKHDIYIDDEVFEVRCKTCGNKSLGTILSKDRLDLLMKALRLELTIVEDYIDQYAE